MRGRVGYVGIQYGVYHLSQRVTHIFTTSVNYSSMISTDEITYMTTRTVLAGYLKWRCCLLPQNVSVLCNHKVITTYKLLCLHYFIPFCHIENKGGAGECSSPSAMKQITWTLPFSNEILWIRVSLLPLPVDWGPQWQVLLETWVVWVVTENVCMCVWAVFRWNGNPCETPSKCWCWLLRNYWSTQWKQLPVSQSVLCNTIWYLD